MTCLLLLSVHLVGAALPFGTGRGIAFFAWFGYRRGMHEGDIGLIRGGLRLTVVADTVFTAVGVTGLFVLMITRGHFR